MKRVMCVCLCAGTMLMASVSVAGAVLDKSEADALADQCCVSEYSVTMIDGGITTTVSSADNAPLVFEAGSLGKPVAAYVCLQLAKEERLSLDDTITQYLEPDWITEDNRMASITIRQLLSHTAGFSPSFEMGVDKRLYFEAGSHFSYSGVGYIYLQKIVERVYGGTFQQAAQEYVFVPLQMHNSTFEAMPTVAPHVRTSSLVVYIVLVWCAAAIVLYVIGFLIGLITKFKYYSKRTLFAVSVAAGFIVDMVLLTIALPRMLITAMIFGGVGFVMLWATKKSKRLFYIFFSAYILISAAIGLLSPFTLPAGPELFAREANAAYSLKTTSQDMALFVMDVAANQPEMMDLQVQIDETNGWGMGLAIENTNGAITYWHSGINPGMQSLFVINPESRQAVVVLTNSDYGLAFAKEIAKRSVAIAGEWEILRTDVQSFS